MNPPEKMYGALEVLHSILDARGVTLEAGEWSRIGVAIREERLSAVMRYILASQESSGEQPEITTQNTIDYGTR